MDLQRTPVAVYGANGHTGRFVLAELRRRDIAAIAVVRHPTRVVPGTPSRVAAIDDAVALDHALAGCGVVINCAGPFLDTAAPLIEAALRNRCSYVDITAEQASAQATFAGYDEPAREAGITVIPGAGFYGGLADLLASALVREGKAESITTAVALDHWWPTEGTRRTGERNHAPRVVIEAGEVALMPVPAKTIDWTFDASRGPQPVVELPLSEIITISRHLRAESVRSYLSANALADVRDADTPAPIATDADGRSAQRFAMDVVVSDADGTRRGTVTGRDIYAVSAPIVVEAAQRLSNGGPLRRGALSLGQAFDARDFLDALAPLHLEVSLDGE